MKKKITMYTSQTASIQKQFSRFLSVASAKGFSPKTIQVYREHLHCISKHLDVSLPLSLLTKADLESAVASMRESNLSPNSISSYMRAFNSFLSWCREEGYTDLSAPAYKANDTWKETYTDDELKKLLQKPSPQCSFCEYRNWIIVQFLLNSGCRAATVRNILNGDVDLKARQVVFRHTKTGKIQVIPLCSSLTARLQDYMQIRGGSAAEYLFCNEHGEMLTENALRLAIARYNRQRGVQKTSIHMFRHTFARKYLLDCGGNAFTLQKLLGHSTLEMTKHYCAIFNTDLANGFDNMSPLEQLHRQENRITMPHKRK